MPRKFDGVSIQTKKKLVDLGLNKPEDFIGPLSSTPAPRPMPLGGDPTRRVPQSQYNQMAIEAKKRTDAARMKAMQKRKPKGY